MQQRERRRAPRHAFRARAEVTAAESLVAAISNLSQFGCFVKTTTPFPVGKSVSLKITYDGRELTVPGEVAYVQPTKGMGIAFGAILGIDQAILDQWLAETGDRRK